MELLEQLNNLSKKIEKSKFLLILMILFYSQYITAQEYISVISSGVNIRFSPSSNSSVITQAKNGNIFELIGEKGDWFEINMFTGEYRYIYKTLCKKTAYIVQLPVDDNFRKKVFTAVLNAEDKAFVEAEKKYPYDILKQIDYQRILEDKYKLNAINNYNVQPPIYNKLIIEGVKKGWDK